MATQTIEYSGRRVVEVEWQCTPQDRTDNVELRRIVTTTPRTKDGKTQYSKAERFEKEPIVIPRAEVATVISELAWLLQDTVAGRLG